MLTATVVYTAFIHIWGEKANTFSKITLCSLFECFTREVYLTSTVGQSIQGVAFVAQTLKTTRGVHTCVIACALKIALIYICNQTQTI